MIRTTCHNAPVDPMAPYCPVCGKYAQVWDDEIDMNIVFNYVANEMEGEDKDV